MKKCLLLLFFLYLTVSLLAQPYFNEWIDYKQQYYKIKIAEDGVYRIPQSTLLALGLPLESIGFQLYHQGKQIPIYLSSSETLGENDYIEFVGYKNDGIFDTQLYANPDWQMSTENSLFKDTAAYFLVWNNQATAAQRFESIANDIPEPTPTPLQYFMAESQVMANNVHYSGYSGQKLQRDYLLITDQTPTIPYRYADFELGEGYTSLGTLPAHTYTLATPHHAANAPEAAQLSLTLVGRSVQETPHQASISIDDVEFMQTTFVDFDIARITQSLANDLTINEETKVSVQLPTVSIEEGIFSSVNSIKLRYPHRFEASGQSVWQFTLSNQDEQYIEMNGFNGGESAVAYDVSNQQRIPLVKSGEHYQLFLPAGNADLSEREIWLVNTTATTAIQQIEATAITSVQFTDFTHTLKQGDYIIISPNEWITGNNSVAKDYAHYRSSTAGGNHASTIVSVEQLYDQFAYGIAKHPLAIRQFINFAIDHWAISPQHLLLMGKAVTYNQFGFQQSYDDCLVPTYGQRPSDNMLTFRDHQAKKAQLAVGRIPALREDEVRHYLDKVMVYEQQQQAAACTKSDRLWQKQIIHAAGNDSSEQFRATLLGFLDTLEQQIIPSHFGGVVNTYAAKGDNGEYEDTFPELTQKLNEGVGIVTFWGGTQQGNWWQFPIDTAKFYNNEGRYPLLFSAASFSGDIHQWHGFGRRKSMPEDYVLQPNAGAIAYIGAVGDYLGYYEFADFQYYFYDLLTTDSYGQTIGQVLRQTVDRFYETADEPIARVPAQHMTLAGDPAIRVHVGENPEYVVEQEDIRLLNPNDQSVLTEITMELDSFDVEIVISNLGKAISESIQVEIGLLLNEDIFVLQSKMVPTPLYQDTLIIRTPNNAGITPDNYQMVVAVDANGDVPEICEDNNQLVKEEPIFIEPMCEGLAIEVGVQTDAAIDEETGVFILPIGETATITATDLGAAYTYQWSNHASGTEIGIATAGVYELTVTHSSGCVGGNTISIFNDQFVWAGDANNDGRVDHHDLLYMGLAYNATGPIRPINATTWNGLPSLDWSDAFLSETPIPVNYKHADSNGDGIVNANDAPIILDNYHQAHNKAEGRQAQAQEEAIPLFWEVADTVIAGYEHIFSVQLGDESVPANDVYGIAFTAEFRLAEGNDTIALNAPVLKVNNSWLGTVQEDMMTIDTCLKNSANWDVALTRTNQKGISGHGTVCNMICVMEISSLKRGKRAARTVEVAFSNIKIITLGDGEDIAAAPLVEVAVDPHAASFTLIDEVVSLPNDEILENAPNYSLSLFPNPTKDNLYLSINEVAAFNKEPLTLKIYDIMGRVVQSKTIPPTQNWNHIYWDVQDLTQNTYLLVATWGDQQISEKLLVLD